MSDFKKYSFINLTDCISAKLDNYIGITLESFVTAKNCRGMKQTKSGKKVYNLQTLIHNRGKYIANKCGIAPREDDDGACWAQVSLWDKTAERFAKYLEKHPKSVVIFVGSISVTESDYNGKTYINVNISASDFFAVRDIGEGAGANSSQSESRPKPDVLPEAQDNGFGPDFDIIDDEGDLPF